MSPSLPFSVHETDGILTLSLDTPSSSVNIFSITAANQLVDILREVRPSTTRAVVITSAKPRSFVNGVGLMLANAVKTPEDAARLTEPVQEAYSRLRTLAVPTIAVIRGACYGCGVELSLQCAHRVAIDVGDTEFYMTEIADYLFVPVFGGTRDLPRLLGLSRATDFLVWGQRWNAREALAHGLVDACFTPEEADAALGAFIRRLRTRTEERAIEQEDAVATVARGTRARIAALPPSYRTVYEDCFALLESSALGRDDYATARKKESEACGRSAMTPESKAAQGFFFVRQIAEQRSKRGAHDAPGTQLVMEDLPELARRLEARRDDGVKIASSRREATNDRVIVVARHDVAGPRDAHLHVTRPSEPLARTAIYAPDASDDAPFYEVASRDDSAATLYAIFLRAGLRVVRSRAADVFVADTLVDAFASVLEASVEADVAPARAARALRDFGFFALPTRLLASRLDRGKAILEASVTDAVPLDDDLVPALSLTLLAWARATLAARTLEHPAVVDVLARDLLGFPLGRGSLCRYLTTQSVGTWLTGSAKTRAMCAQTTLDDAEEYASHGHDFYR